MTENINQINLSETELYEVMLNKIEKIKDNLIKVRDYSKNFDNNKNLEYLKKLSSFSTELANLKSLSKDIFNEFILQSDPSLLSNFDQNKRNSIEIEKKVQNTFLPFMLYLQVLLQNSSE